AQPRATRRVHETAKGMTDSPEARLAALGLELPAVPAPLAAYVPAVRTGRHVYTAGQLPMVAGKLLLTGKVGAQVSPAETAALALAAPVEIELIVEVSASPYPAAPPND